ncbi:MAG: hypothetical protein Q3972_09075 [Corynebacterium sp.]|nr:hypothetical protein [Corynebacterium sp.]
MKKLARTLAALTLSIGTLGSMATAANAATVTYRQSQVNQGFYCEARMDMAPLTKAAADVQSALATQARLTAKEWGGTEDDVKDNALTKENMNILDNEYLTAFSYHETENITKENIQQKHVRDVTTAAGLLALVPAQSVKEIRSLAEEKKLPITVVSAATGLLASSVKPTVGPEGTNERLAASVKSIKPEYLDAVTKLFYTYADESVDAYNKCSDLLNKNLNLGLVKVTRDNFIGAPATAVIPLVSGSSFFRTFSL